MGSRSEQGIPLLGFPPPLFPRGDGRVEHTCATMVNMSENPSPPPDKNLTKQQTIQPGRLDELDGLRGLLSLWVAVAHILCWTGFIELKLPHSLRGLWIEFTGAGPAVDTFMILSGFAITFLLHSRNQSYFQFIQSRFFRIYPVYIVCLGLGILASLITPFVLNTALWRNTIYFVWDRSLSHSESTATFTHTFWHITLLNGLIPKNFLTNSTGTLLAPAWSISLEWQYYLIAPLLARYVRSGTGLLVLAVISGLGLRYSYLWQNPHLAFLPAQLPLFLIGIGSYHLYIHFSNQKFSSSNTYSIISSALIALSVLSSWHRTSLILWSVGFGCIFAQGDDYFSRILIFIRKILLCKPIQKIGKMSYPIYLIHWPIILFLLSILLILFPKIHMNYALLIVSFIGLPLILLSASILHKFIENPFITFGKRLNISSKKANNF